MLTPQISGAPLLPRAPEQRQPPAILSANILLSSAHLPPDPGSQGPPQAPVTPQQQPSPDQRGRDSALGVSHGFLSTGVGAAVLYIGLNVGLGFVVSTVAAIMSLRMAVASLLSEYCSTDFQRSGSHQDGETHLRYYRPEYAFGRALSYVVAGTGTGFCMARGVEYQLPCLCLHLAFGVMYGLAGRRGMPFEAPPRRDSH